MKKRERDEARERSRQENKLRAQREAELRKLKKLDLTDAEFKERVKDLGLWLAPADSPATQFLMQRMGKVAGDGPQFDSNWKQAVVDLVAGDTPLDPLIRRLIAGELHRLYFLNTARDRRRWRQVEVELFELQKRHLLERGMTATEAEKKIAESQKLTVDALRKKIQRARP